MNQKKKKQAVLPQEPLLDILATPQNRRIYWGSVAVIYSLGYALSVWGNLYFGVPRGKAFIQSFTTLLVVIALQTPLWFWYRKRMKGTSIKIN